MDEATPVPSAIEFAKDEESICSLVWARGHKQVACTVTAVGILILEVRYLTLLGVAIG